MRIEEVRARLAGLPSDPRHEPPGGWPPVPDWLRPTRIDGGTIPERPLPGVDARRAAALACIAPGRGGEAQVLLTERPDYDGAHAREVSLPGGREEPEDERNPVTTALREAEEEIGLDAEACGLAVLGLLQTTWIPASNYLVTPVVAVAERPPALVADPREVVAILQAPIDVFLPGGPMTVVSATVRGGWRLRYGAFDVEGRMVWGATARILAQLGALLAGSRPEG